MSRHETREQEEATNLDIGVSSEAQYLTSKEAQIVEYERKTKVLNYKQDVCRSTQTII